jgi:hypothetical protein
MLRFQVDGLEPFVKQLDEMQKSLEGLRQDNPLTTLSRQAQDMNRKRPYARLRKSGVFIRGR